MCKINLQKYSLAIMSLNIRLYGSIWIHMGITSKGTEQKSLCHTCDLISVCIDLYGTIWAMENKTGKDILPYDSVSRMKPSGDMVGGKADIQTPNTNTKSHPYSRQRPPTIRLIIERSGIQLASATWAGISHKIPIPPSYCKPVPPQWRYISDKHIAHLPSHLYMLHTGKFECPREWEVVMKSSWKKSLSLHCYRGPSRVSLRFSQFSAFNCSLPLCQWLSIPSIREAPNLAML
jgi:hypothetical protein